MVYNAINRYRLIAFSGGILMGLFLFAVFLTLGGLNAMHVASLETGFFAFFAGVLGFLSEGIAFCLFYLLWKTRPTKGEKQKRSAEEKAAFYIECAKAGVKTCKSAKDIQKATLIAKKMNLTYTDITVLFAESKQHKKMLDQMIKEEGKKAAMEQMQKDETQEHASLIRYASYSGREKRIAMLSDEQKELLDAAKALQAGANTLLFASQFKEKDSHWATIGGATSAIAGPVAGMAAAMDAQAKTAQENARIRAQNRKNLEEFMPVMTVSYEGAAQKETDAKKIADEIEAAKTKLIADISSLDCFKQLTFDKTTISVSDTGTCTVHTTVSTNPFKIFDDVPAVIDGTIVAQIYDGDQQIGTAQMVFPVYGLERTVKLTGMSLFCGQYGHSAEYRVEFSPENLWAMEL